MRERRRRVQEELTSRLRSDTKPIVISGALGVGKSFLCRLAVRELLQGERGISVLAIFWGWEGIPVRRCVKLMTTNMVPLDWLDSGDIHDEGLGLPVQLSSAALESPVRQVGDRLGLLLERGTRVILVVDKYDSVAAAYWTQDDHETLARLYEKGATLLLETRGFDLGADTEQTGLGWLKDRNIVRVPPPSQDNMVAMGRDILKSVVGLELDSYSAESRSRIVSSVVSKVGRNPGTLRCFASGIVRSCGFESSSGMSETQVLECIDKVGNDEYTVKTHLDQRWDELGMHERQALAAVVLEAERDMSADEILRLWSAVRRGGDRRRVRWQRVLERLQDDEGMVESGSSGHRLSHEISGDLLKDLVRYKPETQELREGIGGLHRRSAYFDWTTFLGWWLLSVFLYFVLSVVSLRSRFSVPWEAWAACWLPPLAYAVIYVVRVKWSERYFDV